MERSKELELISGLKSLSSYNPNIRNNKKKAKKEEDILDNILDSEKVYTKEIELDLEGVEEIEEELTAAVRPFSDEDLINIKIGGEDIEVTFSELKNGYMKQSDYTKKTQELAKIKDDYIKGLKRAEKAMKMFNEETFNESYRKEEKQLREFFDSLDWDKVTTTDMPKLMKLKIKYEKVKKENDKYQKEMYEMKSAMQAEKSNHEEKLKKEEIEKLFEELPDLADSGKSKEIVEKICRYLENRIGKDKVEIVFKNIMDHRDFLILRDAMVGNDYLTNKLPKKSEIQLGKRLGKDGLKDDSSDNSKKSQADRTLRKVKSRGDRAAATTDELMTILASKI